MGECECECECECVGVRCNVGGSVHVILSASDVAIRSA